MNLISTDTLFLLISFVLFTTSSQDPTPVFDQLRDDFEQGRVFTSEFSHRYLDSYTGEESITSGMIWIANEKYKVESEDHILVVDDEISRVYDGIRNRLLVSEYIEEEDDYAPSRMLQGVDDSYSIREESRPSGTFVILENEDPFAVFQRVEIELDTSGIPQQIYATDQADNQITTRFEDGRFIQDDPLLFELNVPESAERVDLRH